MSTFLVNGNIMHDCTFIDRYRKLNHLQVCEYPWTRHLLRFDIPLRIKYRAVDHEIETILIGADLFVKCIRAIASKEIAFLLMFAF